MRLRAHGASDPRQERQRPTPRSCTKAQGYYQAPRNIVPKARPINLSLAHVRDLFSNALNQEQGNIKC
jgi:hypothetical protein